eukprot:818421-Prymnesium_polylepis.2
MSSTNARRAYGLRVTASEVSRSRSLRCLRDPIVREKGPYFRQPPHYGVHLAVARSSRLIGADASSPAPKCGYDLS